MRRQQGAVEQGQAGGAEVPGHETADPHIPGQPAQPPVELGDQLGTEPAAPVRRTGEAGEQVPNIAPEVVLIGTVQQARHQAPGESLAGLAERR
ncbi:MAG TPA: hypothetical protein DCQ09_06640, partial [Alcanivorax sp.]|nr:hypothetical protein [Alcanivorax sp.]